MNKKELINSIKLYLFDMDGTLYLGNELFPSTIELLKTLKEQGKKYLFMTNNSSKSVEDYIKKLNKLGIEAEYEDFITSSQATVAYILENLKDKTFYVCGTKSLIDELNKNGIKTTTNIDEVEAVLMGYDTELNYQKLIDVSYLLTKKDIPYIATNLDFVCPTEWGYVPDCGSVCDMIYNATKKRPFLIGKPSPVMPLTAIEKYGVKKEETCVVGDRIYTDIKSGLNAGINAFLVMSGETNQAILDASEDKPTLVLESINEILESIK